MAAMNSSCRTTTTSICAGVTPVLPRCDVDDAAPAEPEAAALTEEEDRAALVQFMYVKYQTTVTQQMAFPISPFQVFYPGNQVTS